MIEATRIANDIAMVLRALAFIDFEKDFRVPWNTLSVSLASVIRPPTAPNGLDKFSSALAILTVATTKPALIAPANMLPQSIELNISEHFVPRLVKKSVTPGKAFVNPAIKPAMINPPIAMNTLEGDAIPRTSLALLIIFFAKSTMALYASIAPSLIPFTNPLIMSAGIGLNPFSTRNSLSLLKAIFPSSDITPPITLIPFHNPPIKPDVISSGDLEAKPSISLLIRVNKDLTKPTALPNPLTIPFAIS